jgi:hypothetical protein
VCAHLTDFTTKTRSARIEGAEELFIMQFHLVDFTSAAFALQARRKP